MVHLHVETKVFLSKDYLDMRGTHIYFLSLLLRASTTLRVTQSIMYTGANASSINFTQHDARRYDVPSLVRKLRELMATWVVCSKSINRRIVLTVIAATLFWKMPHLLLAQVKLTYIGSIECNFRGGHFLALTHMRIASIINRLFAGIMEMTWRETLMFSRSERVEFGLSNSRYIQMSPKWTYAGLD